MLTEIKQVIPDFELLAKIGEGSYGEVYLAKSVSGQYRAIKIIYKNRMKSDEAFRREFRGVQQYENVSRCHEALIDVLYVGINEKEQFFYYVMEAADDERQGRSFDPLTYRPRTLRYEIGTRTALPIQECIVIGLRLTGALVFLQEHGLVHRDIKPSNIVFVKGQIKLADIGLVADVREAKSLVGTPGYAPPEHHGTYTGDVYSLGKVLFEMSTGLDSRNFGEAPTEEADTEDPRFASFNGIVSRACAKHYRKRYRTAKALYKDLLPLYSKRGSKVKPPGSCRARISKIFRFIKIVCMLTGILIICSILFEVVPPFYNPDRNNPEQNVQPRQLPSPVTLSSETKLPENTTKAVPDENLPAPFSEKPQENKDRTEHSDNTVTGKKETDTSTKENGTPAGEIVEPDHTIEKPEFIPERVAENTVPEVEKHSNADASKEPERKPPATTVPVDSNKPDRTTDIPGKPEQTVKPQPAGKDAEPQGTPASAQVNAGGLAAQAEQTVKPHPEDNEKAAPKEDLIEIAETPANKPAAAPKPKEAPPSKISDKAEPNISEEGAVAGLAAQANKLLSKENNARNNINKVFSRFPEHGITITMSKARLIRAVDKDKVEICIPVSYTLTKDFIEAARKAAAGAALRKETLPYISALNEDELQPGIFNRTGIAFKGRGAIEFYHLKPEHYWTAVAAILSGRDWMIKAPYLLCQYNPQRMPTNAFQKYMPHLVIDLLDSSGQVIHKVKLEAFGDSHFRTEKSRWKEGYITTNEHRLMEFGEGILSFIYYETGYREERQLHPPASQPLQLEVMIVPRGGYSPLTNSYSNGKYAMILDAGGSCRREYRVVLSQDILKQVKTSRAQIVSPLKQFSD